jgi:hypothetical protein
MLPKYYGHVQEHENTLITKFFGLHRITVKGGKKVCTILSYGPVSFLLCRSLMISFGFFGHFVFRYALWSWGICFAQNYKFTVVMI